MALTEPTQVEVELKFKVEREFDLLKRLLSHGARSHGVVLQEDEYFEHPSRNLRTSDETLRIRASQGESWLTYKGPKLSKRTKIREEIEIPLTTRLRRPQPGIATSGSFPTAGLLDDASPPELALRQIFLRLGFEPLAIVRKSRQVFSAETTYLGKVWPLSIGLDRVDDIGTFVEIETIAAQSAWREAEQAVWQYAGQLGLSAPIKSSYLALCLRQSDD